MTFWSALTFVSAVAPIVVIVQSILLARIKKDPSFLIFIFPMAYTTLFYTVYLISVHYWDVIPAREFQLTVRLMIVLYIASLVIFLASRFYAHKYIKEREQEFIEEIINGRNTE